MGPTRGDVAYGQLGMELELMSQSRVVRRTSSHNEASRLGDHNDIASPAFFEYGLRPSLDVHIDEGFDVPLITQTQSETSSRLVRSSCEADISCSQASLIAAELTPTTKVNDDRAFDAVALLDQPLDRPKRQRRSLLQGWRAGVAAAAVMTTTIFLINLTLTIWASLHFEARDGIGDAYVGDCGVVSKWSTTLHILINGLSSAMFSASNYTMQCLTAPTRKECDVAHARGDWLDIGVPSVRNLVRIRWSRRITWGLLALSSIPIHFLYNSAVFKELENNASTHNGMIVSPQFLEPREIDFSVFPTLKYEESYYGYEIILDVNGKNISWNASTYWGNDRAKWYTEELQWYHRPVASQLHAAYRSNPSLFDKLDPKDCSKMYGTKILSGHSHVMFVMDSVTDHRQFSSLRPSNWSDLPLQKSDAEIMPYHWECDLDCQEKLDPTGLIRDVKFEFCLAKKVEPKCKLQFSTQILAVVILCNFGKSVLMLITLWRQRDETLLTFGDAVASWLDCPDDLTKGRCLASRSDVQDTLLRRTKDAVEDCKNRPATPREAHEVSRWRAAVSDTRWRGTMVLCSLAIGITLILLILIQTRHQEVYGELLGVGKAEDFGSVDPELVLSTDLPTQGAGGLIAAVLVVNTPQLVLSFCYLLYNGLFTCMHLAHEYSGYAECRKSLRVTTPRGSQRSTYWLQLPYTYGIPLMVASATLHWLVSQSLFLVRITVFWDKVGAGITSDTYRYTREAESKLGFSIGPIITCIVLATCMLLTVVGMGFQRLESNMPVAASCSFALAAASHRPKEDVDASILPVMWGEVREMGSEDVGHCCFTSHDVVPLVLGKKYAGTRRDSDAGNSA